MWLQIKKKGKGWVLKQLIVYFMRAFKSNDFNLS